MKKGRNLTENNDQTTNQKKMPKLPEFEWVCELAQQFNQQIQRPLQIREAFFKKAETQKCLSHNITYSIYCTICRKALCASCMYNSLQHRKHRVIPIQNATEQLKQDLKTFESKIMKIGYHAESLVESNGEIIMKIEKQYNPLVSKLKDFYQSLRVHIKKKEKEHLQLLKEIKESTIAQVSHYNRELARMIETIMSKLKLCVKEEYKFTQSLTPRSMLETLIHSSSFINQNFLDGEKFKFPTDVDKISELQTQIEMKIDRMFNTFQNPLRSQRSCQIQKLKSKNTGKKVSFVQTRFKLQQTQKTDKLGKHNSRSLSNIAGRSQLYKI